MSTPAIRPDQDPNVVGVVGSPSTTAEVTMDVVEAASNSPLLGDLVYTSHGMSDGTHLIALGTVGEVETHNRWHEDPNMRGVLRVHGSLPHLSSDGDVRTAKIGVQAVYAARTASPPFPVPPTEAGGAMSMSPSTGTLVRRVSQDVVDGLTQRHAEDVVYLGPIYRSDVHLPVLIRDFTTSATDGAYHTGVFGRSGSGKTAWATLVIALQMRHLNQSFFIFDPQGQFSGQEGLVVDLQQLARDYGRPVQVLSIARDIQLPKDAVLFAELLMATDLARRLGVRAKANQEYFFDEFQRVLQVTLTGWDSMETGDLLRDAIDTLRQDQQALQRIYSGNDPRTRMVSTMSTVLDTPSEFAACLASFTPPHSLFRGEGRTSLRGLITQVTQRQNSTARPYVVIDLSDESGTRWLDDTGTKARLMRKIASELRQSAERAWKESGSLLNCSVIFDEAATFAPPASDNQEIETFSNRLVEYVRQTRKTGLGWTFITQDISSINPGIYNQLTVRAYGYGLTSGGDLAKIRDQVGSGAALDLYRSFPDPKALSEKNYPFMITGPVSPLSFTAAPVFMSTYVDLTDFNRANSRVLPQAGARAPQRNELNGHQSW